jgi:ribulose-phosphate 3-epimerase
VSVLEDILADLDLVLVMSVNPGFGGQQFIENSVQKVKKIRTMATTLNPNLLIEVDGGVSSGNIAKLVAAGADVLVAGNAVFAAENPEVMIQKLKTL